MSVRVYVAGPLYSSGTAATNVKEAQAVADRLMRMGLTPFVPHLGHLAEMIGSGHSEERWLEWDKQWLLCCHAVYRLPGESRGADLEEEWAREDGIPVFRRMEDLIEWAEEQRG